MKLLKCLLLAITLIVTATGTASAQKGMSGIGVNLGFDYYIFESSLLNKWAIKYQYNFSNYYRIEPVISYSYTLIDSDENANPSSFEIGINNHFFLTKVKRFRPYAIAGIGYMHLTCNDYGKLVELPTFYFCGGIGVDYRISHKLSMQASLCYLGNFDYCATIDFEIGIAYNF